MIIYTSDKREGMFGEWSRTVRIGDQEYSCSIRRGKSVRIPYSKKRGWHWYGSVYRIGANGGHVWTDRVPKSLGCKGMLIDAGVIEP